MLVCLWDDGFEWEVPGVLFKEPCKADKGKGRGKAGGKGGKIGKKKRMRTKGPAGKACKGGGKKKGKTLHRDKPDGEGAPAKAEASQPIYIDFML